MLSAGGYNADEENSSVKALEKISNGDYDLVISDLQMPGVSDLIYLKPKPQHTNFIIVTGFSSVDSAVESMKAEHMIISASHLTLTSSRSKLRKLLKI
ncbi:MAG: response regulator [Ignavibacteria bacterium]|nr:response regulator [Ignavibacteria bacterium]